MGRSDEYRSGVRSVPSSALVTCHSGDLGSSAYQLLSHKRYQ